MRSTVWRRTFTYMYELVVLRRHEKGIKITCILRTSHAHLAIQQEHCGECSNFRCWALEIARSVPHVLSQGESGGERGR